MNGRPETTTGIVREWKTKGKKAAKLVVREGEIESLFMTEHGSLLPEIVGPLLERQLVEELPCIASAVARSGRIIDAYNPNVVVAQLSVMPGEAADVLAARTRGIPTIGCEHGFRGATGFERNIHTTEFFATNGLLSKQTIMKVFKEPGENIYVCGNPYYEGLEANAGQDKREIKRRYGLDAERPLLIFCDTSQWPQNSEWRYSTREFIKAMLSVKESIPGMQIIHRVHHGMDYCDVQRIYDEMRDPDIMVQNSLLPCFRDIVDAADVVVSHNSSSIIEAIVRKIPVIYLCALSEVDPCYGESRAVEVCGSLHDLPAIVAEHLGTDCETSTNEWEVGALLDSAVCGLDGDSVGRFAEAIIDAAHKRDNGDRSSLKDVLRRFRVSCEFSSSQTETQMAENAQHDLIARQ